MAADKTNISVLQSWGIASARNTSGVVLPREDGSAPGYFDVPQGPSLVRWDILRQKKLWAFQPHGDAVFCMRLSPDGKCIVTLSYGGEIGIWDASYSCLFKGAAECSSLHHVSILSLHLQELQLLCRRDLLSRLHIAQCMHAM